MLERDAGEFGGYFSDCGAPELRDFKDVGFVDAGDFVATLRRELKGDAGYADDFILCIAHGVPGFASGLIPLAGLAEVEAAEQFAHEKNVGASDDLGAERAVDCELFEGECGAQIGKTTERGAQLEQTRFRALAGRERVELIAADGAEQNSVGGERSVECFVGEGRTEFLDCNAANRTLADAVCVAGVSQNLGQYFNRFAGDFRTDAVAGGDQDFQMHECALPMGIRVLSVRTRLRTVYPERRQRTRA